MNNPTELKALVARLRGRVHSTPCLYSETADALEAMGAELVFMSAVLDSAAQTTKSIIEWLEANQPDVFQRGLWDAVPNTTVTDSGQALAALAPNGAE